MSLRTLALKGMAWSLLDKLVNQLGMLFVMIYLARVLGPESFGLVGMLSIFVLISQSLINSGFSQALVQRSKHVTDRDTSTVFFVNITVGLALYILLYASAPMIANFYNEPVLVGISRVLFLVLVIDSFAVVTRAKLTINIDFKSQAIASASATLVGAVVAIYMAENEYGYWALVALTLARAIVTNIVLWWYCRWLPSLVFCYDSFRRLFGFGSKLLIAGLIATSVRNLYVLLIGRYFGPIEVGYFSQAHNLTNQLAALISSVFQSVTYPLMTSVNDDIPRMISIYKRLIQITMICTLPFLVGFAAVAEEFTLIFLGDEWLAIVPALVILSFARVITPISAVNMNLLNAIGRSDLFLKVDLSKLPMTLAALWLSVPYGVVGVAWAMLFSSVVSYFINAYLPGKFYGFGAVSQLCCAAKPVAAVILMYVAVRIIELDNIYYSLLLKVMSGVFTYVFALYFLKVEGLDELVASLTKPIK